MHMLLHIVPADGIACAVRAENGIRRVGRVAFRVIPDFGNDTLRIAAWLIAAQ